MTISTVKPGLSAALASPYTPIAVINGTPVYALQGGRAGGIQIVAGDADGDDDDELLDGDEDDDDSDGDDEPDEDEGEDLPATRGKRKKPNAEDAAAAMQRMEAALRNANKTAAKYRRAGRALERLGIDDLPTYLTERGIDPETGLPYGEDVVDPNDLDGDEELIEERPARRDSKKNDRETVRAVRAAASAAEARAREMYVPILAQQAATIALTAAGFKGEQKQMDKILRLIDPNDLEVVLDDGEFEILGIDEAIADIQENFPVLFRGADDDDDDRPTRRRTATKTTGTGRAAPARRATGARDVDGGERGKPAKKQGGWVDQIVAQMDRRGR